ncbi:MAG: hypothetical protein ACRDRJ_26895 [Streptosporangiaceae bacterium]
MSQFRPQTAYRSCVPLDQAHPAPGLTADQLACHRTVALCRQGILAVKALYELRRTGGNYALVTMCTCGGQGIAAAFEGM